MPNHEDILAELHHHAMITLYPDDPEATLDGPEYGIDSLTEVDEFIYRLDMPDHGGLPQVYGYYNFDGILKYALAGVQGEEFTLIYVNKEI